MKKVIEVTNSVQIGRKGWSEFYPLDQVESAREEYEAINRSKRRGFSALGSEMFVCEVDGGKIVSRRPCES